MILRRSNSVYIIRLIDKKANTVPPIDYSIYGLGFIFLEYVYVFFLNIKPKKIAWKIQFLGNVELSPPPMKTSFSPIIVVYTSLI